MKRFILGTAALWSVALGQAQAQSLDYGALERLFGEPVTTSVTGYPQRASDVPATMQIVTADQIRRSGARDIPGVLAELAGVDVAQWTNDDADVSVRGYNQPFSHRLLVLIDGRQVYADWFGFTPWSLLPVTLSEIRQIEVVEGPNSALFGFNAVGGVINIITDNPLYDKINTASVMGGTQGLAQGSAVGTFKIGDAAALRISAGGYRDDDFSTPIPPMAFAGISRVEDDRGALDMNGAVRLGENVQLRLDVSHATSRENQILPNYAFGSSRYRADSAMASVDADTGYGLLQAQAYVNEMGQIGTLAAALPDVDFNNHLAVLQLRDTLKPANAHTLSFSFEYRHNGANTTPFSGGEVSYDVVAGSALWAWQILPSLTLTDAVRLDGLLLGRSGALPPGFPLANSAWNRTFLEPSFNSGLVWKADEIDTVRLLAGRGVQLPSLADFGAFLASTPLFMSTGVPTLAPTVVTNYELGWDRLLAPLGGLFRASLFHEDTYEMLAINGGLLPTGGTPYTTRANVGSSTANGIELSLRGTFEQHWQWSLGYRAEEVSDHFAPGLTPQNTDLDFADATPSHLLNAHLGWSRGKWQVDGYLRYQSHILGLFPGPGGIGAVLTPVDDYVALDARIAYLLTDRVTLSLSAQNFQSATEQQTSGPDVERRVFATVSVKF
jgi:outer membrane cobalamin receptor